MTIILHRLCLDNIRVYMVDLFVTFDSIKDILGLPTRAMLWTRHSAIIFEVDKRGSEYVPTFLREEVFEDGEVVDVAEEVDMSFLFGDLFEEWN